MAAFAPSDAAELTTRAIILRRGRAPLAHRPVASRPPAWGAAYDALVGGCGFLMGRARNTSPVPTTKPLVALRRAGNCLNELDRLLTILLDEGARLQGLPPRERTAFERSHDTPRKLRRLDALTGMAGTETQRLQAIARLRRIASGDLCGIPRAMLARDLASATGGLIGLVEAGDTGLFLSDATLAIIARFYLGIAERLALGQGCGGVAGRTHPANLLDFSTDKPHLKLANVACDGI